MNKSQPTSRIVAILLLAVMGGLVVQKGFVSRDSTGPRCAIVEGEKEVGKEKQSEADHLVAFGATPATAASVAWPVEIANDAEGDPLAASCHFSRGPPEPLL